MPTFDTTATSPRAPKEVFAYLAHFSNAARWDPGVVSARETTPGEPRQGSRYRLEVLFFGLRSSLEYRIEEIDAPHRVVLQAENSVFRSTDVIEVSSAPGGGSTVTYHATLRPKGPFAVFSPLVALAFRRVCRRAATGLRVTLAT
jgi:uncharacterized protein YndB with AHSA1/START domain